MMKFRTFIFFLSSDDISLEGLEEELQECQADDVRRLYIYVSLFVVTAESISD